MHSCIDCCFARAGSAASAYKSFAQELFFQHALQVRFIFAVFPAVDNELVGVPIEVALHLLVLADGVNRNPFGEPTTFHERRCGSRR